MKSTTLVSPFDPNSPQLTTTNDSRHKQMVSKLSKPYRKEIERTCQKIQDESKNKQPKVYFLICENDNTVLCRIDPFGKSEFKYPITCLTYAVGSGWIRTDSSSSDMEIFYGMSEAIRGVLRKKDHCLVVVVNGYICDCVIISPNASPKGFGV